MILYMVSNLSILYRYIVHRKRKESEGKLLRRLGLRKAKERQGRLRNDK
jgi:hypothetical protein